MSPVSAVDPDATVTYETLKVEGLNIAYREAGKPTSPKLVLLHGFPASSHQYRNLIPALADRFHVIAPDYPFSQTPIFWISPLTVADVSKHQIVSGE